MYQTKMPLYQKEGNLAIEVPSEKACRIVSPRKQVYKNSKFFLFSITFLINQFAIDNTISYVKLLISHFSLVVPSADDTEKGDNSLNTFFY